MVNQLAINIIGFGIVGKAQSYLMQKLGHYVYNYDPFVLPLSNLCRKVDVSFICTHENQIENVIKNLIKKQVEGLYVIKSTTPIGKIEKLIKKYKIHLCHNPEFLRENYSFYDVINQSRVLIGYCCLNHANLLKNIYTPLNVPIFLASPTETELTKILSNSIRANMISFWNEINQLCLEIGLNTNKIAELLNQEKTIGVWEGGNWGTKYYGKPYGGSCLPKDLDHLIKAFQNNGLNPLLFEAVKKYNIKLSE